MKGKLSPFLSFNFFIVVELCLLAICTHESCSSGSDHLPSPVITGHGDSMLPTPSPVGAPQPLLPLLAPSPLAPFTNTSIPKLSGHCSLNFTAAESLLSMTAIDCWEFFAPYLANVICCPQLEATLTILIGQSSKQTDMLSLNSTLAKHCLSDMEQILISQGANDSLNQICSIHSPNLTQAYCPVSDVADFESMVDTSKLLSACEKIDPVKECCNQICQNATLEAATRIASNSELLGLDGPHVLPEFSTRVNDCRQIVLRWVASKLNPSHAKKILRGLSNCNVNKVCPLVFPNMRHVKKGCGNGISNKTACCDAMGSYVSHLQKQSFITNLQSLKCSDHLARKLRRSNITEDVYSLCHISLKDFSPQVGNQEAGCLLPSLPSDATFDRTSGISFLCDLNDNVAAPWPSTSKVAASSCNKSAAVNIPALPVATSGQRNLSSDDIMLFLLVSFSLVHVNLKYL